MDAKKQVKAVGVVSIVLGILGVLTIFILAAFLGWGLSNLLNLYSFLAFICLVLIPILYFIGGIYLLKYKNWARILLAFLAVMMILGFPIGTGLGIWFLYVLLNNKVKKLTK